MKKRNTLNKSTARALGTGFIFVGSGLMYFTNPLLDGLDTALGAAAVLAGLWLWVWATFIAKQ